MSAYVIIAYVIFCAVPLGFGIGTALQRRRLTRELAKLEKPREC